MKSSAWFNHLFFISITLLICCTSDSNKPVEVAQRYGTGEISRRYTEIAGKKEGAMTDYFPDGKIKATRLFQNDKQTGRTVIYYPNGTIQETQYYSDGVKNGGDTLFHENGLPRLAIQFRNGSKNGFVHTWDLEGKLIFEAKYEMDSLIEVKGKRLAPIVKSEPSKKLYVLPEGPTGYISRVNTVFLERPNITARRIGMFNVYEAVVILKTQMDDEQGITHDIPQWYQVQRQDKSRGWVIANCLSVN